MTEIKMVIGDVWVYSNTEFHFLVIFFLAPSIVLYILCSSRLCMNHEMTILFSDLTDSSYGYFFENFVNEHVAEPYVVVCTKIKNYCLVPGRALRGLQS